MEKYKVKIYPNQTSPRLFRNKFLEYLTKAHPIVIDTMYIILGYFLINHYYQHHSQNILQIAIIFTIGFFTWTFFEYMMHRFLYHDRKDASYNNKFNYLFHGIHHEYPSDRSRVVLPVIPSLAFAAVFFTFFWLTLGKYAFVFGAGFLIGYITYMTIHYAVHKYPTPKRFSFWWNFHNIHHYQQHDRAFGVTNPFWDMLFGTMPEKNRKTIEIHLPS